MYYALLLLIATSALPAMANREPSETHTYDCLRRMIQVPVSEVPYEWILDRPVDVRTEARATAELTAQLVEASRKWQKPPEGLGSLEHHIYLVRMAPHWLRRVRGYLMAREDWGFAQRELALVQFCAIIRSRLHAHGTSLAWTLAVYRSKHGDVVVTGAKHRLVLCKSNGALMSGEIPYRERTWIERVGSAQAFYASWHSFEASERGLQPVPKEPLWETVGRSAAEPR